MQMSRRTAWIAVAVVALLAVVIVVGLQSRPSDVALGSPSPTVSATVSASATAAAATATTAGSSSPTGAAAIGIYDDAFGFVVNATVTGPTVQPSANAHIRSESSNSSIATFVHEGFWVSPDGSQIAYWTARTSGQLSQLMVARASSPQSQLASSSLSPNESGGRIIWANDSSAIAYVLYNSATPTTTTIRTLNTRPGGTGPGQVVFTFTEAGKNVTPIAWDRTANMLAVGLSATGPAGVLTDYILVDSATPGANARRTPVSGRIRSMEGSSDAKYVLGIDVDAGLSYWPLASISSKVTPGGAKAGAVWRPGTHEIGFVDADKLVLYGADQAAVSGGFSGAPAGASVRTFRADGNAVLLAVPGDAQTTYTLVVLGKRDPSPGDRVTFQDSDDLRASIRLR